MCFEQFGVEPFDFNLSAAALFGDNKNRLRVNCFIVAVLLPFES
jgi:hypothetical protein